MPSLASRRGGAPGKAHYRRSPGRLRRGTGRARPLGRRTLPDLVIATGLANGRAAITPERIAINLADARIPDNSGAQPLDLPIDETGPSAQFSGLPVKAIVACLAAEGIPAALSNTAGTFVCNALMYRLMRSVTAIGIRAGFIQLPCSPELAFGTDGPFLETETIARALELAIEVSCEAHSDAPIRGGAEQ